MSDENTFWSLVKALRKRGWWARARTPTVPPWKGWKAIPTSVTRNGQPFVHWTELQHDQSFGPTGDLIAPLHLQHSPERVDELCDALHDFGIHHEVRAKTVVCLPKGDPKRLKLLGREVAVMHEGRPKMLMVTEISQDAGGEWHVRLKGRTERLTVGLQQALDAYQSGQLIRVEG